MDNELWRWVWVVVTMVMGIGEIFTAGFFLLPFALGGALAAAAAWLDWHGSVQWLLFFGGTGVAMLFLRRFMGNQDRPDDLPVGANRYLGMTARVIEQIDLVANAGRVRVESDEWRAVSSSGPIAEGALVTVTALSGTKLMVELEEPPPPDYVPFAERAPEALSLDDPAPAQAAADADSADADHDDEAAEADTPRST